MPQHLRLLFVTLGVIVLTVIGTVRAHAAEHDSAPTPLFAKALVPGDTIVIVAPAKYLDEDRVTLCKVRLEEMGFKVRIPATLFRKHGFLAGTDEERARELNAAFADPKVAAIFPGTGGYGTTRIVDKLDYDVIRKNPKILIGFSDITGLHVAINQRTGLVTFHSPNPEFGLGDKKHLSPFAAKWFWRALLAKSYGDPLAGNPRPVPVRDRERGIEARPEKLHAGYTITIKPSENDSANDARMYRDVPRPITLVGGKARGRLIGGNLSVLHAMMGTPYEIQTDGKILFIEDVGEAPYRVDRMLNTLRLAGKFDHVAGVILGAFMAREDEAPWDTDATQDDVLRDYFAKLNVPVLMHFPVGHVRYNATLPVGAMAELDATGQTLRVLENPVRVKGDSKTEGTANVR